MGEIDRGGEQFVPKSVNRVPGILRELVPLHFQFDIVRDDQAFAGNFFCFRIEKFLDAFDQFAGREAARRNPSTARKTVERIAELREDAAHQPVGRKCFLWRLFGHLAARKTGAASDFQILLTPAPVTPFTFTFPAGTATGIYFIEAEIWNNGKKIDSQGVKVLRIP